MNQMDYKSLEGHRIALSAVYQLDGVTQAQDVQSAQFDPLPRRDSDGDLGSAGYTYPAIPRQSRAQYLEGVVELSHGDEQQAMTQTATTITATMRRVAGPRKKSRKHVENAEEYQGEQKARGRPRLDAHDESASASDVSSLSADDAICGFSLT